MAAARPTSETHAAADADPQPADAGPGAAEEGLRGHFVVVTGANTGIGSATARELTRRGATVVLACRSEERARPVLESIRAERRGRSAAEARFVLLDLADMASIRAAAAQIASETLAIDVLINNAGVAGQRGYTRDGFELSFGTNHLGHFLLTMLLAPKLHAATRGGRLARIVNVSSQAHYSAPGIDFDAMRKPTRTITGLPEYAVSKLANVLFTRELARRIGSAGVHSYAVHPGTVASDAWRRLPWPIRPLAKLAMLSNEQGARTSLYCATSAEVADHDGRYYDNCRERAPSAVAQDPVLAQALWDKSVQFTGADLTPLAT